jgi:signal transduction histidine kinase
MQQQTPQAPTAGAVSRYGGLRARIIVFISALLIAVLGSVLLVVNAVNFSNARAEIDEKLALGERVFKNLVAQNDRQLTQAASILSLDFAFRQAVATRDVKTIESVLANHGARINADLVTLVSLDQSVIADTLDRALTGRAFPFSWLIDAAEREGRAAGLVVNSGRLYQLVVVPVRAPEPIAWAAFGFLLHDRLDKDLQNLTRLKLSFIGKASGDKEWKVLASTQASQLQEAERLALAGFAGNNRHSLAIDAPDGKYQALIIPLEQRGTNTIVATLTQSVDEALAPYRRLGWMLLALGVVALLLSMLCGALIAHGITRPIQALAEMSRRIEAGDLTHTTEIRSRDEIGELARRFNLMREALARSNEILEQRVTERTAELSAANRELESFSYSVSHDLRAPVRAINGFTQMLSDESASVLPESSNRLLQRILLAAQRMDQLIEDLIRLSRVSRHELHRSSVGLSGIAQGIIEDLRQTDPGRQVDCIVQPGLVVSGDASLLRIAMDNLVRNAWKFTSKAASPRIEIGATIQNGDTVCFVRDNGAGFDMGYADKLFMAFQRMHHERDFPGTGIGLAITQRIVLRHGGRIWAESAPDQGATFYFTLSPPDGHSRHPDTSGK